MLCADLRAEMRRGEQPRTHNRPLVSCVSFARHRHGRQDPGAAAQLCEAAHLLAGAQGCGCVAQVTRTCDGSAPHGVPRRRISLAGPAARRERRDRRRRAGAAERVRRRWRRRCGDGYAGAERRAAPVPRLCAVARALNDDARRRRRRRSRFVVVAVRDLWVSKRVPSLETCPPTLVVAACQTKTPPCAAARRIGV